MSDHLSRWTVLTGLPDSRLWKAAALSTALGILVGALAWWWLPAALGLLAAGAAGALLAGAPALERRLALGFKELHERLTLDQLQRGDSAQAILGTPFTARSDFVMLAVRELVRRPSARVVELGAGQSTLTLARVIRSLGLDCRLLSVEHDAAYAQRLRGQLRREGLESVAQVVDAPLRPLRTAGYRGPWYDTERLPAGLQGIDLLIVDGPPKKYGADIRSAALPVLSDKLAPGALILVDDLRRRAERRMLRRWQRRFPQARARAAPALRGAGAVRWRPKGNNAR